MCRTLFLLLAPGDTSVPFFVELPARVVKGDAVAVWPLLPVEMAATSENDWLQNEGEYTVHSTCWTRDELGIYLAAALAPSGG